MDCVSSTRASTHEEDMAAYLAACTAQDGVLTALLLAAEDPGSAFRRRCVVEAVGLAGWLYARVERAELRVPAAAGAVWIGNAPALRVVVPAEAPAAAPAAA